MTKSDTCIMLSVLIKQLSCYLISLGLTPAYDTTSLFEMDINSFEWWVILSKWVVNNCNFDFLDGLVSSEASSSSSDSMTLESEPAL